MEGWGGEALCSHCQFLGELHDHSPVLVWVDGTKRVQACEEIANKYLQMKLLIKEDTL